MRIKILAFTIFITSIINVSAQDSFKNQHIRNVVWMTPVTKNTIINGVAIGILASALDDTHLLVNGLNIEVSPGGIFAGLIPIISTFCAPFNKKLNDSNSFYNSLFQYFLFPELEKSYTTINGVSVSIGGPINDIKMSGFCINGFSSFANKVSGVEISGLVNLHYSFKGLTIAGLRNKVSKVKGVQIGLFNTTKEGQVLQIGLINRIGNRVLPIINFSFKKSK